MLTMQEFLDNKDNIQRIRMMRLDDGSGLCDLATCTKCLEKQRFYSIDKWLGDADILDAIGALDGKFAAQVAMWYDGWRQVDDRLLCPECYQEHLGELATKRDLFPEK